MEGILGQKLRKPVEQEDSERTELLYDVALGCNRVSECWKRRGSAVAYRIEGIVHVLLDGAEDCLRLPLGDAFNDLVLNALPLLEVLDSPV